MFPATTTFLNVGHCIIPLMRELIKPKYLNQDCRALPLAVQTAVAVQIFSRTTRLLQNKRGRGDAYKIY